MLTKLTVQVARRWTSLVGPSGKPINALSLGDAPFQTYPNSFVRFYAGHHGHEEAPKPYKRNTLSPLPADAEKTAKQQEQEVQNLEGWLFGRKVVYHDPLKPIEDCPEVATQNGWLFNRKPLPYGQKREWEDWEPITYAGTAISVGLVAIYLWARPNVTIQAWALEEARERKIIRSRREYELKQSEQ